MRKTLCSKALGVLLLGLSLSATLHVAEARLADNMGFSRASRAGSWRFTEDPNYNYAKYSSSHLLSLHEAIPHHSLSINIQDNLIDSYTFRVGCMLQTVTPMFELKVPGLDVRMFDTLNDIVYARFLVDDNQEFSLRGELLSRNRIVFAPITKSQERGINDIYTQMQHGEELKIGLLQGDRGQVRVYKIPLSGFGEFVKPLNDSCVSFHKNYTGTLKYLPDYMAKEPDGYAPKDYTLKPKPKDDTDMAQPMVQPQAQPKEEVAAPIPAKKPEVMPFAPGGGPASIGPDGMPIGADGSAIQASSGQPIEQPLGTVNSAPMQIGPDGAPVNNGAGKGNGADAGNGASSGGFEPVPQNEGTVDIF